MSNLKNQAISGAKWNGLSSIFSFILGIIQIAVLSRFLEVSEIGLYSIILVILAFSGFFGDLGVSNAIIHFQKLNIKQIRTLYWINIAAALFFFCVITVLAPVIANFYNEPQLIEYIRLSITSLLCFALGQNYYMQFRKALQFKLIAFITIIQRTVVFITILVALIFFNLKLYAVIIGMIAGAIFFGIIYLILGWIRFSSPFGEMSSIKETSKALRFGQFHVLDNIVSYFSSILDKLILGKLFGVATLGYYEYATIFTNRPITIINPIFNAVGFPVFSKIQDNHDSLNQWYIKMVGVIAFIMAPVYLGYFVISHELVAIYLGIEWLPSADILNIICILGFFFSISNPMGSYILALGKPDIALAFSVYHIIINGILFYIGSYYSVHSFLLIYMLGTIILTVPVEYYLRYSLTRMSFFRYMKSTLTPFMIASIMTVILLMIKNSILDQTTDLTRFVILVGFGALIYFGLNWILNKKRLILYYHIIRNR